MWNCLNRVLSAKNLPADFRGKANTAANFLRQMQTDFSFRLEMKLTNQAPASEIQIETEAKVSNVSLSILAEVSHFSETMYVAVDAYFINQLKSFGLFDHISTKVPTEGYDIPTKGYFFPDKILASQPSQKNWFWESAE